MNERKPLNGVCVCVVEWLHRSLIAGRVDDMRLSKVMPNFHTGDG